MFAIVCDFTERNVVDSSLSAESLATMFVPVQFWMLVAWRAILSLCCFVFSLVSEQPLSV